MPVIAHNLLESLEILANTLTLFAERCVSGIEADAEKCRRYAESSVAIVTALSPRIGYHQASAVARESVLTGKTIREVAAEKGLLSDEELEKLLKAENMLAPTEGAISRSRRPQRRSAGRTRKDAPGKK